MAKMTREHFKLAAEEIKFSIEFDSREDKMKLARFFIAFFKRSNPQFKEDRFFAACGLDESDISPKRKL